MQNAAARAFPLSVANENEEVQIVACAHRGNVARQLCDLGLPIGSRVTVVTRHLGGGPMVVARDSVRIALGAGMAHRIFVAPARR